MGTVSVCSFFDGSVFFTSVAVSAGKESESFRAAQDATERSIKTTSKAAKMRLITVHSPLRHFVSSFYYIFESVVNKSYEFSTKRSKKERSF
jgi:hypothetical protein